MPKPTAISWRLGPFAHYTRVGVLSELYLLGTVIVTVGRLKFITSVMGIPMPIPARDF